MGYSTTTYTVFCTYCSCSTTAPIPVPIPDVKQHRAVDFHCPRSLHQQHLICMHAQYCIFYSHQSAAQPSGLPLPQKSTSLLATVCHTFLVCTFNTNMYSTGPSEPVGGRGRWTSTASEHLTASNSMSHLPCMHFQYGPSEPVGGRHPRPQNTSQLATVCHTFLVCTCNTNMYYTGPVGGRGRWTSTASEHLTASYTFLVCTFNTTVSVAEGGGPSQLATPSHFQY